MAIQFKKATKKQSRLRMALIGPSGSGKTYTALSIATSLEKPVAVIDTERGSASKYSDVFDFDVLEPESFHPKAYIEAILAAVAAGYGTLIIDSLSHAWIGKDGALALVDNAAKRSQSSNSFAAWRDVTPLHNALVDAIISARCHVIATMRAKTEYIMEQNDRGKTVPRKIGIQPVQRDGLEYEFDVVADLNLENELIIGKTRCSALAGKTFHKAGADVAGVLSAWLSDGVPEDAKSAVDTLPVDQAPTVVAEPEKPIATMAERLDIAVNLNDEAERYAAFRDLIWQAATIGELADIGRSMPLAKFEESSIELLREAWGDRRNKLRGVAA